MDGWNDNVGGHGISFLANNRLIEWVTAEPLEHRGFCLLEDPFIIAENRVDWEGG